MMMTIIILTIVLIIITITVNSRTHDKRYGLMFTVGHGSVDIDSQPFIIINNN